MIVVGRIGITDAGPVAHYELVYVCPKISIQCMIRCRMDVPSLISIVKAEVVKYMSRF
jgi:hypothetical protein